MKKKITWWQPEIGPKERQRAMQVLKSGYINDGEVTAEFEKKLATLLGVKHVVATPSGTMAIFAGLLACGIKPGDEVLVPDITFIATANAVTLAGAKPVFVDVHRSSLNFSIDSARRMLSAKTKAIVPVHVSGRGADMKSIMAFAKEHRLAVVEDAAEALLSKHGAQYLGTIGDVGAISFSPNKTITTGQGGVVITNNSETYKRLIELKDQGRPVRGTGGDDLHPALGFNLKLTNLQAAVGLGQLTYLSKRVTRLRALYRKYKKELEGISQITLPGFDVELGETPQWVDVLAERRDELYDYLTKLGIGCRRFWFPIHTQGPYRLSDENYPNAIYVSRHAMWLPSAFSVTDKDVSFVCQKIRAFYK